MLKDFEAIKSQLAELADVINKFKSEAVQLRIVELVLRGDSASRAAGDVKTPARAGRRRRRGASKTAAPIADNGGPKKKTAGGDGAVATLIKVHQEGFFKSPRTINDILAHCETNLARRIKANEISGKLGRMVRAVELKRTKNADGQYEYTNP